MSESLEDKKKRLERELEHAAASRGELHKAIEVSEKELSALRHECSKRRPPCRGRGESESLRRGGGAPA